MAALPMLIRLGIWLKSSRVTWWEWLVGTVCAYLVAVIIHVTAFYSQVGDTETWSGRVLSATYQPEWVEEYQVAIYKTVTHTGAKGNTYTTEEFSHYETRYRTHEEEWWVDCNYGTENGKIDISHQKYDEVAQIFGNSIKKVSGYRPGYYSGDKYNYEAESETGELIPVTKSKTFENRIKCSKTLFSFIEVPKEIKVFPYPDNSNPFSSGRLLGGACGKIDIYKFDQMNAELGPKKLVNIIIVGFDKSTDSSIGQYQQAKWINGKKNDLVICYGTGDNLPNWVFCFGWTESELVKRNLETIFLDHKINNDLIPLIKEEVIKNYTIKDWSKFDYISVEPPTWTYWLYIFLMILTQVLFWIWANQNEFDKNGKRMSYSIPFNRIRTGFNSNRFKK
jgi:hypothetical protein